jgi:hypothetical protein
MSAPSGSSVRKGRCRRHHDALAQTTASGRVELETCPRPHSDRDLLLVRAAQRVRGGALDIRGIRANAQESRLRPNCTGFVKGTAYSRRQTAYGHRMHGGPQDEVQSTSAGRARYRRASTRCCRWCHTCVERQSARSRLHNDHTTNLYLKRDIFTQA